ncbi:type II toxin-antitoxin system HicA family toxin [bacterium]|nr:type II toxin-antitoxin system HicA family toxin [FCB group bacterium]MBL7190244.1 type II toxin-antitoxin system HicA family toxin [bacterium]
MSKLPRISGQKCINALIKMGFYIKRTKGSHVILGKLNSNLRVVIPNHKELDRGTLHSILKQAEISAENFLKNL